MERVSLGASQLVDVETGGSAHVTVVADKHIKVLWRDKKRGRVKNIERERGIERGDTMIRGERRRQR